MRHLTVLDWVRTIEGVCLKGRVLGSWVCFVGWARSDVNDNPTSLRPLSPSS
jgi:hypothetical protein